MVCMNPMKQTYCCTSMAHMGCLKLLFILKRKACGHGTQVMAACLRGEEWQHSLSLFQELKCWDPEPLSFATALRLCGFAFRKLSAEIQLRPECYANTAILCGGFRQLSPGSMSQHHMQSLRVLTIFLQVVKCDTFSHC